jgi:S1-C subfamily serine protease
VRPAFCRIVALVYLTLLCGCATSSGRAVARIADTRLAPAYIPLHKARYLGLDLDEGAAVTIAPGIAVTNAHNENLLNPALVLGKAVGFDLLFFRTLHKPMAATGLVRVGEAVTAYGQGAKGDLRIAHGVVKRIQPCPGCGPAAYFVLAGDAGPGFSGGPVLDARGRLIGITFGYRDGPHGRRIYAYDMARVRHELALVSAHLAPGRR